MLRIMVLWIGASLLWLPACSSLDGEADTPEPLFRPGDYGGDLLPGAEEFWNVRLSPDGTRIALVRLRTPGSITNFQLWIMDRDGTNPELIGVNAGWADWSPDGKRLAVGVMVGISFYIYTLDLETREATQWSGREDQFFSKPTASLPIWFEDGERLLVSVFGKAYKQPFKRGIYSIHTRTGQIEGPLLELFESAFPGNHDQYAIGVKYTPDGDPLDGNAARYDFATGEWTWITHFAQDSLNVFIEPLTANPATTSVVFSRFVENAWQLFLMESDGAGVRQITRLGGDNPRWSYDGRKIFFRRDVHRGPGARYVPFVYDTVTETEAPLWPNLPDSLPAFPPLPENVPLFQPAR